MKPAEAISRSAAVHTSKNAPLEWHVELGEKGVWVRFVTGSGKCMEFLLGADQADRMAGALHAAALDRKRMVTMKAGEHVGRIQ